MSFVIAMTTFVFNGIIDKVAISLNISVANTGLLNTMYSYGAAFGVPLTLVIFRRIERLKILKTMLFVAMVMNVLLVLSQNFIQLLIIRLVMGVAANSYGVLAIGTVVSLAEKGRQGRSLAFYIMGSTLALAVGIPLTRLLTTILDWRAIFICLTILMMGSLVCFEIKIPKEMHNTTAFDLKKEQAFLKNKNVVRLFCAALIMFIGYGAFYTYIMPYLLMFSPRTDGVINYVLVAFGIASFIGNLLGGQFADRFGYRKTLLFGAMVHTISILVIVFSQQNEWLTIIVLI